MAHSPRPRASLRPGVGLAKTPMPPRSFPASLRCRRCRQRRAGATRFSPGPALFRRREACSSVLRRLCPREVSRPKGPFFLRSCPGVPTSAQGDVFLPRRGARATGKLHARRSCNGFTQGAACPSFTVGGLPRRRAAHPSPKGWSAAIFGTGRAGSLRNRRAATAPARDGAFCVETSRRLLCAALSPPAWDARAEDGAFARRRSPARGIRRSDGRPQSDAKTTRDWEAAPARSQRRAMFFLLRCGTRTAITRFPSSAWEEGSAASLGPRRRRNEGSNAPSQAVRVPGPDSRSARLPALAGPLPECSKARSSFRRGSGAFPASSFFRKGLSCVGSAAASRRGRRLTHGETPMATVMQHEELIRRALAYILERRRDCPDTKVAELLDSAGARFNLSPLDQEALERLLSLKSDEGVA